MMPVISPISIAQDSTSGADRPPSRLHVAPQIRGLQPVVPGQLARRAVHGDLPPLQDAATLGDEHRARACHAVRGEARQRLPVEQHLARGRAEQAGDGIERAALAGAVRADERGDLPSPYRQRHAPHGVHVSVEDVQPAHLEQRGLAHASLPRYAAITSGWLDTCRGSPCVITFPKLSTVMRSQTCMTSCTLCSTRTTDWPVLATCRITVATAWTSAAFIPAVGSSSRTSRGDEASARAISTRRWSPYDRPETRWCARSRNPTRERSCSAASRAFASSARAEGRNSMRRSVSLGRTRCAPTMTFSRAVSPGNSRMFWYVRVMP